jgi:MFS family permease
MLRFDVVGSAFAISIFLLLYYILVGFAVVYFATVYGYSEARANSLANWYWISNALTLVVVGVLSDRVRVRKPFMVVGTAIGLVGSVLFALSATNHQDYYTIAWYFILASAGGGMAYVAWMASFTETVERHNPAATATGLAIWGWIIRVVVFISFLVIPLVVTSVTPLVTYGAQVGTYAAKYGSELTFAASHPQIVATATKYQAQIANAKKFAPELAVIQAHPALFTKLASYPTPAAVPPRLAAQAVAAAGGGAKGLQILSTINANKAAINGVIAVAPKLAQLRPFAAQLNALSKVPPGVFVFMKAHGADVQKAAAQSPGQWRSWYWICFGGVIFFLLSIPVLRGRWKPSDARRDEQEHEAMVEAELAKLNA